MHKFKIRCSIPVLLAFLAALPTNAQQPHYSLNDELIYRINFGSPDEVKLLLEQGANPNATSSTGDYAVSVAVDRDDADAAQMIQVLLSKGANPNMRDKSGMYPLVSADMNNKTAAATALIAGNADYHVVSPNGKSLVNIARENNNQQMEKLIQDKLDEETRHDAEMRNPERFKMIVHQYVFNSCNYQYWSYILGSRQEPDRDTEINKQIADVKTELLSLAEQIQKYYPNTPHDALKRVADNAAKQVYDALDGMISNGNRRDHKVGTTDDANTRCQQISNGVNVDFVPAAMNTSHTGDNAHNTGTTPVR